MTHSSSASPVSGVAERYAGAFFELATTEGKLDEVESGINAVSDILSESEELGRMIRSPVYSSDEQGEVVSTLGERSNLPSLVSNFLGVLVLNRRLFCLPDIIRSFRRRLSEARGEVMASLVVPRALTDSQVEKARVALREVIGKDVSLRIEIDSSLLGGMIIQVGSRQLDTSLRSKLLSMKSKLNEVE